MLRTNDDKSTASWLDQTWARFEAGNRDVVLKTRSLLQSVIPDDAVHGRLINTLSMLEHIGSYKIMATQHGPIIDQPTLKHVAEESQHAYLMKRQAERTAGRPLEYLSEDLLAPAAARMYFQRLESALVGTLRRQRSARAAYLYMSMIVEFRALWFYRSYQQTLKKAGHTMSLKRVLGEEQAHLTDMANRLEAAAELSDTRADAFLRCEKTLYERLLAAMQRNVVALQTPQSC